MKYLIGDRWECDIPEEEDITMIEPGLTYQHSKLGRVMVFSVNRDARKAEVGVILKELKGIGERRKHPRKA